MLFTQAIIYGQVLPNFNKLSGIMRSRFHKIPSPSSLIVFEASARHLSFTKAAFELSLSQAAVSKQIAKLEGRLNTPLFVRSHRRIALTEKGEVLYGGVYRGLEHMLEAVELLQAPPSRKVVTVSATTAFAQLWLFPRLARFKQANPEVDLRLLTSDDNQSPVGVDVNVAIKYGEGFWPNNDSTYLASCDVIPVCSPKLLEETPVNQLKDLLRLPLIDLDIDHWQWVSWKDWLLQQNIQFEKQHVSFEFNNVPMLYYAAEEGQGVALGWSLLVKDVIAKGRLVAPFDAHIQLLKPWGYYLLIPRSSEFSEESRKVKDWIIDEINKDDAV